MNFENYPVNEYLNFGTECTVGGHIDEAIEVYEEGIHKFPQNEELYWRRCILKLLKGEWHHWPRANRSGGWYRRTIFNNTLWTGQVLEGKSIFLHHDLGIGDFIQFIRYADVLKKQYRTHKVLVECPEQFMGLCRLIEGVDQVVKPSNAIYDTDFHAPLMHIPAVAPIAQSPNTYINLPSRYHEPLDDIIASSDSIKVGICWKDDITGDESRSFHPSFVDRLSVPGIMLFNFQKKEKHDKTVNINMLFETWMQIACALRHMDLVVSVDTAVAHLAAAMGKPVWLLISQIPDWRWGLRGFTNYWYPTMILFRQAKQGYWTPVIEEVRESLEKMRHK